MAFMRGGYDHDHNATQARLLSHAVSQRAGFRGEKIFLILRLARLSGVFDQYDVVLGELAEIRRARIRYLEE